MKKARFLLALAVASAILIRPQAAVTSAQHAMRLWYTSVAPALFPFLALMPLLTGPDACVIYERIFSRVMGPLFHLNGSAAPAILIGLISGSPGGAIALSRIAAQTNMKKSELRRVAPIICGLSPAYLVMGVGVGLFESPRIGFKLAGIQLGVQLFLLFLSRFVRDSDSEIVPIRTVSAETGGVRSAVEAVLTVCGYMVLFSSAAGVVARLIGVNCGRALLLAVDLPSGLAALSTWEFQGRFAVAGMAVGFGGICVAAQNMDVLQPLGVRWKDFLTAKLAQSAVCGALSGLIISEERVRPALNAARTPLPYAFSLLSVLILCAPVLVYLSKNLILNNSKPGKSFSS